MITNHYRNKDAHMHYLMTLEPNITLPREESLWDLSHVQQGAEYVKEPHQNHPPHTRFFQGCTPAPFNREMETRYNSSAAHGKKHDSSKCPVFWFIKLFPERNYYPGCPREANSRDGDNEGKGSAEVCIVQPGSVTPND